MLNLDLKEKISLLETLTASLESTKTQCDQLQISMEDLQETLSITRIERDSLGQELTAKNAEYENLTENLRKIADQTTQDRFLLENKDQELECSLQLVQDLEKKISTLQLKPRSSTKDFTLNIPPDVSDWSRSDNNGPSPNIDKPQTEDGKKMISSGGRDPTIADLNDPAKQEHYRELEA